MLFGARQLGSGLYKIALKIVVSENAAKVNVLSSEATQQLYHKRMGHQNKRHIKDLIQEDFDIKVDVTNKTRKACMYGKTLLRVYSVILNSLHSSEDKKKTEKNSTKTALNDSHTAEF